MFQPHNDMNEIKFLIEIKDGQPINHPIILENFIAAFPEIDLNRLPQNFAKFVRVPSPSIGPYEVNEGVSYQKVDDYVTDVWNIRQMTEQERQEKINFMNETKPFPSWALNEETCEYVPPVSYPNDGKSYRWNENTLNWVEILTGV